MPFGPRLRPRGQRRAAPSRSCRRQRRGAMPGAFSLFDGTLLVSYLWLVIPAGAVRLLGARPWTLARRSRILYNVMRDKVI